MPIIGDFQAWVEVDDIRLEEYNKVKVQPDMRRTTCWIASEEGKNFTIHLKHRCEGKAVRCEVYLDGRSSDVRISLAGSLTRQLDFTGIALSSTEERLLQFAKAVLTDNEDIALKDEKIVKELGTIRLEIEVGRSKAAPDLRARSKTPELIPVHEKAKKAAAHRIQPGARRRISIPFHNFISDGGAPVAIIFQYAPNGLLQAKGIIPRPVWDRMHEDNTPEEVSDDEADAANEARIRQLEEEIAALRNARGGKRKRGVKQERRDPEKRIKMESLRPNRIFAPGEVIDLT